ncbi:hypothetical protein V1512DRAFT_265667 [Lipomyces arxii]|uniref:uncharacterized protein n=1 Tax=Lipomyces arxii TaxID=56418 RepID=UPI0034CD3662
MRQAATSEKLAEIRTQQKQISDASKWSLDNSATAVGFDAPKVKIVKGIGFEVIDSTQEDSVVRGRRSWGMFNKKYDAERYSEQRTEDADEEGKKQEDENDEDDDEDSEAKAKRRQLENAAESSLIKTARKQQRISVRPDTKPGGLGVKKTPGTGIHKPQR